MRGARPQHLLRWGMPSSPRKHKKTEDINEATFRVMREATTERQEKPADPPAGWTAPTEEETPPPKIP